MINKFKKIVIKIGSSSIVNERTKIIKTKWLRAICRDIASLHSTKKIIVVCSGAIALGSKFINEKKPIRRLEDKQAAAAVGQIILANHWQQSLKKNKINTAQLLLTLEDSEMRRRYLNVRKTIYSLHKKNIIPIINENDTVATEEIRYGDNDRLAARVAQMIDADLLILEDGHCFRNQILNLCSINDLNKQFELKSGNFETLINLSNNGPWMTILPYLHSRLLPDINKKNLIKFNDPTPAREISIVYSKTQLKLPIINALKSTISKVIRGQIEYNDVKVMSPK